VQCALVIVLSDVRHCILYAQLAQPESMFRKNALEPPVVPQPKHMSTVCSICAAPSIIQRRQVVEVDHLTAEAVPGSAQADAPQGTSEPLRAALEAALKAYREGQFAASACSSAAFAVGADSFVLYVSGEQLNLRNWWSGSWVGRYEVLLITL
jgi:F-actin capping protein alpha subunit